MNAGTTLTIPNVPLATVVTRKGQVTIPAPIREALGIKQGDSVTFQVEGKEVKLKPAHSTLAEGYQSIPALKQPLTEREKAARAYAFLQEVEKGNEIVTTTEAVIAEVWHVLSSKRLYNYPKADIVKRLLPVLQLKGLRLSNKYLYGEALLLCVEKGIDFVDALVVVKMKQQGIKILVSFDHDFDDFPFIKREEPEPVKQTAS